MRSPQQTWVEACGRGWTSVWPPGGWRGGRGRSAGTGSHCRRRRTGRRGRRIRCRRAHPDHRRSSVRIGTFCRQVANYLSNKFQGVGHESRVFNFQMVSNVDESAMKAVTVYSLP